MSNASKSETKQNTNSDGISIEVDANFQAWPLESANLSMEDPLLECLVILARSHGRRTSIAALTAGLPLSKEGFASPGLFVRAAERINMSARLLRRPLANIVKSPSLPCILILKDNNACILHEFSKEKGATLTFPETPEKKITMSFEDIDDRYRGYSFFISSKVKIDDRAGPKALEAEKDWFWGAIKKHKGLYKQVVLATFMINIFALVNSIFIMNVYDKVLPYKSFNTLWVLGIGAIIAMIFDFILKNLRAHFLDAAGRKADIRISASIFERIQNIKMATRPPSSGMMADNMREFETLRDFFTSATVATLVDLPFVLLFILLIWLIGGPLVIVPIALVAIIFAFGYFLQKPLAKIIEEHAREGAFKSSVLIETLNGLETIKIQAAEGHNQRKWEEIVEQSSLTSVKARTISALAVSFTGLAAVLCSIFTVIYGAYLVADGSITTGALIATVILSGRVIAPLAQLSQIITKFNQSKTALNRLDKLMKSPVEREDGHSLVSKPVLTGHINFRNLSFRYPGQQSDTLKKVNMEIMPGDKVGIIGAVGCGKTTLERLLLNLYQPSNGSVEIDGLDVRQIELGDLRRNIGVAQQDAYMFYGTIRDNIIMGHEAVPDEAILRAAELSGINEFMKNTPTGLDTHIGERGELLSGGQRQAIAIARALLYDPPILVLDEPTASIDPRSEKILYRRLATICKNKTVILITHRTTLLGLIDKLALMDKGRIVDYGKRDEVIKALQEKKYPASNTDGME